MPSYKPGVLAAYNPVFQRLAADLFRRVALRVPASNCVTHLGSYSIIGRSLPDTVGKIVIYQHGVGTPAGPFPTLANGVYTFVRVSGRAGPRIWIREMQNLVFPQFFRLMSATTTLGRGTAPVSAVRVFPSNPADKPPACGWVLRAGCLVARCLSSPLLAVARAAPGTSSGDDAAVQ
jgi:hypothetical protein